MILYENPIHEDFHNSTGREKMNMFKNALNIALELKQATYKFDDFLSENFFCDWASDGESIFFRYNKSDHYDKFRDSSIRKFYKYSNIDVMVHHAKLVNIFTHNMYRVKGELHLNMYSYFCNILIAQTNQYLTFFRKPNFQEIKNGNNS